MTLPPLGPRGITRYNQLNRDVAAFNYVLRGSKSAGACNAHTLFTLNGLLRSANLLFRRHRDLPYFFQVDIDVPLSQADLAIIVARLTAACLAFEARYAQLTETGAARAAALRQLEALKA
jgi:hypothetical protein